MKQLWHFTCGHTFRTLRNRGTLIPFPQIAMPGCPKLVWLTDMPFCDKQKLGLQSQALLTCDRSEYRYRVLDPKWAIPFHAFVDAANSERPELFDNGFLEFFTFGRSPKNWWVSVIEHAVVLDQWKDK